LSADKVREGGVLVRGGKSLPFGERFFLLHLRRGVGGIRRSEMKPPRPWKGGVSSFRGKVPASRERLRFLLHSSPPLERRGILKREIKILINEENFSIFLPDFYWE